MFNLIRLPSSIKHPAGIEWRLLQNIRLISLIGTAMPLIVLALYVLALKPNGHDLHLAEFMVIGFIILHWTFVMSLWIGCWVVRIMKGPAYVDDPYVLPDANEAD